MLDNIAELTETVSSLRRKHKEILGFELPVGGKSQAFLFRPLTAKEFEDYLQIIEIGDVSDDIIRTTILYPKLPLEDNPIQQVIAGVYEAVALQIVLASGFTDPKAAKQTMNVSRHRARSFPAVVEMFICKAFPSYIPEQVREMTITEQMALVAQAEQLLGTEFPMKEFFGKSEKVQADRPPDVAGLEYMSDAEVERLTEGVISKEALARVAQRAADPNTALERRAALKERIARQRLEEGD